MVLVKVMAVEVVKVQEVAVELKEKVKRRVGLQVVVPVLMTKEV
jgi:hypothetical protein